jgi:hypothetical protein
MRCLLETDPQKVRPVWDQFKLLHPDKGGDKWRERFEQLERDIERIR